MVGEGGRGGQGGKREGGEVEGEGGRVEQCATKMSSICWERVLSSLNHAVKCMFLKWFKTAGS